MSKTLRKLLLAALLLVLLVGAAAVWLYTGLGGNAIERPGSVYLPTGATYQTLIDSLESGAGNARLRSLSKFEKYATLAKLDKGIRPGRYVLPEGASYRQVVQMFKRGLQTPVRLTFNNLRTIDRLAGSFARQTEADSLTYLKLLTDPATAINYGFTAETFIAMFIPNTYEIYWNTAPEALLDRMRKEFDRFWTEERKEKAEALHLSPIEVSTLASIVYEETKMSDEMPRVAGVYINRLRVGMPLQADPTVKFALGDPTLRRILNRHLEVDSPYNTYLYKGLPPGPICMPSIRALDAVLNYEHHNYIYFCASPDFSGYHRFATNLAGHAQNAREYAAALNRQGIR